MTAGHYYKNPHVRTVARLARQSLTALVGTTDSPLLGPNPRRKGLILCAPAAAREPVRRVNALVVGADANAVGVKLSYTCPSGCEATVTAATCYVRAGTPILTLQLVSGAGTAGIITVTSNSSFPGQYQLLSGNTIQWNVTTGGGVGALVDATFGVLEQRPQDRYTVSFAGPAVLDQGPTVYPGQQPLCVLREDVVRGLTEEVRAVSAGGPQTVTVVELFDFLEEVPCGRTP